MVLSTCLCPRFPAGHPSCYLLQVCDVGGGTGFCTLGVVETVKPENVTLVDQSPHQLSKAKAKSALKFVTIKEVCSLYMHIAIALCCM